MKILQVLLALSVLVLVHELGHFFFAKLFRIRVDKFYLFFDAGGFSLFRFKPKGSDTEYGIGCLSEVIARLPVWWTSPWTRRP